MELRQEIADGAPGPARQSVGQKCGRKCGQEGWGGRRKDCPFHAGGGHHRLRNPMRDPKSWGGHSSGLRAHSLRQTERVSLGMTKKKQIKQIHILAIPKAPKTAEFWVSHLMARIQQR